MSYLLDTNVLLRLVVRTDPQNALVRAALRTLRQRGEQLCYTSQNLVEFWRTCTRPVTQNGYGLTIAETDHLARVIERLFTLLPESPAIHVEWRQLVVTHSVSGRQVHDARLVAAMRVHGVSHLLTLNVSDFACYPGISAVHPQHV
jgi:predicted nucleic acid-binding protein